MSLKAAEPPSVENPQARRRAWKFSSKYPHCGDSPSPPAVWKRHTNPSQNFHKALEISIWYQVGNALVQDLAQKWFSAIIYAIWLRSEFRGQHSAWLFGAHFLFFHTPGRILEPRIGFWIPRSTFWPGDVFGAILGSPKRSFCRGMIL